MEQKHNLSPEDKELLDTLEERMKRVFSDNSIFGKITVLPDENDVFDVFQYKLQKSVRRKNIRSFILSIITWSLAYLIFHYIFVNPLRVQLNDLLDQLKTLAPPTSAHF